MPSEKVYPFAMSNVLLVLGGTWHDFDGFADAFQSTLAGNDITIEATYDLDSLCHLEAKAIDLVALYTCLGGSNQHGKIGEDMGAGQVEALAQWVEAGGRLLGIHAATVMGEAQGRLRQLLGARFVSHPPQFDFTLLPMNRPHAITAGIGAFAVHDEFYVHSYDETIQIHMVAFDRGVAHPMVWTRQPGQGRVAYLAPGHSELVWRLPAYRDLVSGAVHWLLTPQTDED